MIKSLIRKRDKILREQWKRIELPKESFRLYPLIGGRYFIVHIGDTLKAMQAELFPFAPSIAWQCLACCTVARSPRNKGLLGILWFAKPTLGVGVVTHEMVHAAFRTMESLNEKVKHWSRDRETCNEERFALLVEHLSREFWNEAYERGYVSENRATQHSARPQAISARVRGHDRTRCGRSRSARKRTR